MDQHKILSVAWSLICRSSCRAAAVRIRIASSWDIFALGGSMAIIVAIITIGFQVVKTALGDPLKSLKQT